MSEVVVIPNQVLNVLLVLGILSLIGIFLAKLYNILNSVKFYSIQLSIILLVVGIISFIFVEVGIMINVGNTSSVDSTLIEFNVYNLFSRVFIIMIWIFWFVEFIMYGAKKAILDSSESDFTRMSKRRKDRINNY